MDWLPQYEALTLRAALVDLGHRTQIELSGADRARFLHNLCTQEIRKLAPGSGCEALLTSVQGKTLGHMFVFATHESLVLDTVAGQAETILKHLDHYLVCEQVTLADRSEEWGELYLGGPAAASLLREAFEGEVPEVRLAHAALHFAGGSVFVRRTDLTSQGGFLVSGTTAQLQDARAALLATGAVPAPLEAFEAARIEAGFPLFGVDISDKNLPQELARDALAMSFVKGCYLGQETVARIDALGHVNKTLVGIQFSGQAIPAAETELRVDDQVVGQVTSASYSPRLGSPLALGYVRRGSNATGTTLNSNIGNAEVVKLPA